MKTRALAAATACLLWGGCSATESNQVSTAPEVLRPERWRGASAAFSASYLSAGAEGEHLRVIVTPEVANPCVELYSDEERVRELDFWFIMVETGQRAAGSYEVVNAGELASDEARVVLTRTVSGRKAVRLPAVRGRVVTSGAEWEAGAELSVELEAEFPEQSAKTIECNSDIPLDDELEARHSCQCEDADGSRFECESREGVDTCCHAGPDAEVVSLSIETTAHFCSAMCNAVAGLENICWQQR